MKAAFDAKEPMDAALRARLADAAHPGEVLGILYRWHKARDAKHSLAWFCKRAGIPSTGYLSDVIKGHKLLNPKHVDGVCRAFGLAGEARRFFRALHAHEGEKDPLARRKIMRRLTAVRKTLRVTYQPARDDARILFKAMEVFCAFGLFAKRPTRADLTGFFGASQAADVDAALQALRDWRLIAEGEDGRLSLLTEHVVFGEDAGGLSHLAYLDCALRDAAAQAAAWFPRKDESLFTSTAISVRREDYRRVLRQLRTLLLEAQARLESGEADALVRFNVQIYPCGGLSATAEGD